MRQDIPMTVECETCPVRGVRCDDCVVTALSGLPVLTLTDGILPLQPMERRAVDRFVRAGLVSPVDGEFAVARREPWSGARAAG